MTDPNPALEHALPKVLADARALAAAGPVDTRPVADGPFLFDLTDLDLLRISGRDRQRFLHAMLSNDVHSLQPGEGCWATLNNLQGRTVADVRLFQVDMDRKEGALLALLEPGAGDLFVDALSPYIVAEKIAFDPQDSVQAWLLTGKGASALLEEAGCELPAGSLFSHCEGSIAGCSVRLIRLDRTSPEPEDFLLWVEQRDLEAVLDALAGATRGGRVLLEAIRVENAQPRFGIDITTRNIPLEAGLKDRAIDFKKGCYIGQEVICRIDSMGRPARQLVRLRVSGSQAPSPGTALYRGEKDVGHITSSVHSVAKGGVVALGYVKKRHNEPGTIVEVGAPGSATSASLEEPV